MSQHKEASDTTESSASGHLRHISDHRCLFRAELESQSPDTTRLETSGRVKGEGGHCDGQEPAYHFLSRYFPFWNGIPEYPVTGSAHTVLAPYWAEVVGSTSLVARQCSTSLSYLLTGSREQARPSSSSVEILTSGLSDPGDNRREDF